MKKSLILITLAVLALSCQRTKPQRLENDETTQATAEVVATDASTADADTTVYHILKVQSQPQIDNALKYFRENNKYKDWDANDEKMVVLKFMVELDGTTSNIQIRRSSGVDELDAEALRLVKGMVYDQPAIGPENKPVRMSDMAIVIPFPAK